MDIEELLGRRWAAQGWGAPTPVTRPDQAVARLGAVQSQDRASSLLAVALRCPGTTVAALEAALTSSLVRTHVLRPTWHLVAAADLRWMLELTAPGILRVSGSIFRAAGLGPEVFARSRDIIVAALDQGPRSREELMAVLQAAGLPLGGQNPAHYLMDAEVAGLVCNGPQRGLTSTYDLVERRVPPSPSLPRDEALARLAWRYASGHGPVTERDLAWWAGLGLVETRRGFQASGLREDDGWWFDPNQPWAPVRGWHWLPAFDELVVGLADRSHTIAPGFQDRVFTKNGIFRAVVTFDGRAVGTWARAKPRKAPVNVDWFEGPPAGAPEARAEFEAFLGVFDSDQA